MKRIFIIGLIIGFILIGYREYKSFDTVDASMKALQDTVQACTIDMQKDTNLICD